MGFNGESELHSNFLLTHTTYFKDLNICLISYIFGPSGDIHI